MHYIGFPGVDMNCLSVVIIEVVFVIIGIKLVDQFCILILEYMVFLYIVSLE